MLHWYTVAGDNNLHQGEIQEKETEIDPAAAAMVWYKRKIVVSDDTVTSAVQLTARQSLVPNLLGTSTSHTRTRTESIANRAL